MALADNATKTWVFQGDETGDNGLRTYVTTGDGFQKEVGGEEEVGSW